ncbi:jg19627 [Pararge aegeria aegeria]|uniref:Jg19627 protein n=1 Tax=Pararge aegeria aegeria TaxID=348720 RepID=A0A8S4SCS7_9NEOP|nr:jg19627 [Pararge aegeria aegeria]
MLPYCFSSGKRQIGSNVLASQLYRSSSFNSSGCGSGGEPADDMYSDVSLEEDVQGLNYKLLSPIPMKMFIFGMPNEGLFEAKFCLMFNQTKNRIIRSADGVIQSSS